MKFRVTFGLNLFSLRRNIVVENTCVVFLRSSVICVNHDVFSLGGKKRQSEQENRYIVSQTFE